MQSIVNNLKEILLQQLEVYQELLKIGESKNKILLTKAVDQLQEMVSKEELLVQQLIDLEIPRKKRVKTLTKDGDAKFEVILGFVEDLSEKQALQQIADQLNQTIEEVNKLNSMNQRLVEQALELTVHSLKLVTRAPKPATYGPTGKAPTQLPQGRTLINKKA